MLQDYLVRVIHERAELYIKITKLVIDTLSQLPQPEILIEQIKAMEQYLAILDTRIKEWMEL